MRIVTEKERELIIAILRKWFGISEDIFKGKRVMISRGGRIYLSGCVFNGITEPYYMGLYIGQLEKDGIRLSVEGAEFVERHASKGILEICEEEMQAWMMGKDLEKDVRGYVIIRCNHYVLGCGKGTGKRIINFLPRTRRIPDV